MVSSDYSLNVEAQSAHALLVLANKLLALARRFAVLLNAVTELEEAVVARFLGLRAGTATG